jgi:DNA-binding transcriptional MerR regulator
MAMDGDLVSVGEAAREAGLSRKALRLYEELGIVIGVDRTPSGYRAYSRAQVELLRFVRRARELGLRLDEIHRLVEMGRRHEPACGAVIELLEQHADEATQLLAGLESRRKALLGLLDRARSQSASGDAVRLCRLTAPGESSTAAQRLEATNSSASLARDSHPTSEVGARANHSFISRP